MVVLGEGVHLAEVVVEVVTAADLPLPCALALLIVDPDRHRRLPILIVDNKRISSSSSSSSGDYGPSRPSKDLALRFEEGHHHQEAE
jgi:hypothetical protein